MSSQTLVAPGIARTERGLVVAGTRITLYAIMDHVVVAASLEELRENFLLTERQVNEVLAYIAAHREAVEEEYREVLRQAEELERYYAERNREVLARVAALPPKPEHAAIWAKLAESRARRQES